MEGGRRCVNFVNWIINKLYCYFMNIFDFCVELKIEVKVGFDGIDCEIDS